MPAAGEKFRLFLLVEWPIGHRDSLRDSPNFEITEETGTYTRVKIEMSG